MQSNFEKVKEFHTAFGSHIQDESQFAPQHIRELRRRLISEECEEFLEGEKSNDFENVAKELADILYVVYGTAVSYGIPMDEVFLEVHNSNMSKLGDDGKPIHREDGKVLKGPHYFNADIKKVLQK